MYSKDHPECGYRQGMHELLAPMYYVVHTESTAFGRMVAACGDASGTEGAALGEMRVILDPHFIEHDSFALFAALMNHADEFFLQTRVPVAPTQPAAAGGAAGQQAAQEEQLTPVVARCRKIQHVLLKQKDPELYQHLMKCKIEPQLYAMRWLRLLFGREFHMQDLIVLWDAIFAYGRSLALADYIAVAMLIYIREQLLQMDELTAMKRLLKYPPERTSRSSSPWPWSSARPARCTLASSLPSRVRSPHRPPRPAAAARLLLSPSKHNSSNNNNNRSSNSSRNTAACWRCWRTRWRARRSECRRARGTSRTARTRRRSSRRSSSRQSARPSSRSCAHR